MDSKTKDKIKEILTEGVLNVYALNNIPVKLHDIRIEETENRVQILMIGVSKNNRMAIVFKALLPEGFISDNIWLVPVAFNEFLKLLLPKLTEYSLQEIIDNVQLKWGLILTIEFDSVVHPINKSKEVKVLVNNNYIIRFTETFNSLNTIEIDILKQVPNIVLSNREIEKTSMSLYYLSELAIIDINHRLRTRVYSLRVLPIKLLMFLNSPNAQFYKLSINVEKKFYITIVTADSKEEFSLPLRLIEENGWIPKMLTLIASTIKSNKP